MACWSQCRKVKCGFPENIHAPSTLGFFWFEPPNLSENSSLGSCIPLKALAFKSPSPSEFPMNLCGGGMDNF